MAVRLQGVSRPGGRFCLMPCAFTVLTVHTSGCTGIVGVAALSVNSTVGEAKIDLSGGLGLTVLLAFAPVDVFLTVWLAVDGGEELFGLNLHRRDIRVDLARGGGPEVEKVAAALSLDHDETARLGALLHAHRDALDAPLSDPTPLDRARVTTFVEALRTAIASDPELAAKAALAAASWSAGR